MILFEQTFFQWPSLELKNMYIDILEKIILWCKLVPQAYNNLLYAYGSYLVYDDYAKHLQTLSNLKCAAFPSTVRQYLIDKPPIINKISSSFESKVNMRQKEHHVHVCSIVIDRLLRCITCKLFLNTFFIFEITLRLCVISTPIAF